MNMDMVGATYTSNEGSESFLNLDGLSIFIHNEIVAVWLSEDALERKFDEHWNVRDCSAHLCMLYRIGTWWWESDCMWLMFALVHV